MIEKLLETLQNLEPRLTAEELQDSLWLARHLGPTPPPQEAPVPEATPRDVTLEPSPDPGPAQAPEPASPSPAASPSSPVPEAGLFLTEATGASAAEAVRVPMPRAIRSGLPLSRSIRPLRVKAASASSVELDEERTAEHVAETGLWQPVMAPRSELRFEAALVVDDSAAMPMWRQTLREFQAILRQSGAFRDIRVWRLATGAGRAPLLLADNGSEHRIEELADPSRSRVVLLFSDCLGAAWQDGRIIGPLDLWGSHGPLAIVQPLPERLWWRSGITTHLVELAAPLPGAPNSRLVGRLRERRGRKCPPGVIVPVLDLSPRWFEPWARMVAQGGRRVFGSALFTGELPGEPVPAPEPTDLTPLERIVRFRAAASPRAAKLASYLAAAPLRQPVMRLVQHAMLPDSTTADLAEVQLSGLLRLADTPEGADPHDPVYEFHDGVRSLLMDGLRRGEAMSVLRNVWNAVREHDGSTLDFPALLESLEHGDSALPSDHAFARVAVEVLGKMGGRYARIAKRLAARSPLPVADRFPASLPPREMRFVGRSALLRALQDMPDGRVSALIPRSPQGMGGEGKSALAVEHLYRSADQYELIYWLPAAHPSAVRARIAELTALLQIPACDSLGEVANELRRTSRTERRCLFVLDGARDPQDLLPFLPTVPGREPSLLSMRSWRILVTSTDRRWEEFVPTFEVDVFEREESVRLLLARLPGLSEGEADLLAAQVNDLPLALDQAVTWQNATGRTAAEYRELFARHLRSLPASLQGEGSSASTAATLKLALEWLGEEHPRTRRFFDLWAFFDTAPVTVGLLAAGRRATLPGSVSEVFATEESLREAMRTIANFTLARFDAGQGTFQTDPVVRELLAAESVSSDLPRTRESVQRIFAEAIWGEASDENAWWQQALLTPHVMAAGLIDATDAELRETVLKHVEALIPGGDFEGAKSLAERALERWREPYGADGEPVLRIACLLADALRGLGEDSSQLSKDTFELAERTYGAGDPVFLSAALGQSAALKQLGRFEDARILDRSALIQAAQRFERRSAEPNLLASASASSGLRLLGRFAEAYDIDKELLSLLEGPPQAFFQATHRLARDLHGLGRHQEALDLQRGILQEIPPSLRADHPLVLQARMSHAETLRAVGLHEEAERVASSAAEIHGRRFGAGHPNTLIAQAHLAGARLAAGRPHDALALQQDAWSGLQRAWGAAHPFVRACAAGTAVIHRALGNIEKALETDRSALDGSHTDPYYSLLPSLGLSIDLYLLQDREAARTRSAETLARATARLGEGHPLTLACAHGHQMISSGEDRDTPVEFFLPPEPL